MPTNPTDVVNPGFTVNALTPIVLTLDPVRGENGQPGEPGQGMNWRGEWQTGVTYDAYDAVSRNPPGASYIAIVNNTSVDPATDNGSVWGVLSAPGATGPPGPVGLINRGNWNATTQYNINDLVSRAGSSYLAIAPNIGIDPSLGDVTHWQMFASAGSGAGDMVKAVYDTNNDGIVDKAALATAVPWTGITGKPTTFPATPHAATHNKGGTDQISPDWTQIQNVPVTFPPTAHAPTHVGGLDPIAPASTTTAGLLKQVSGLTTDYVRGDNSCQDLGTAVQPSIWSVRLRTFSSVGNPNFEVDQRQCGAQLVNAAANSFMCDRWIFGKAGTMTVNTQRQTGAWNLVVPVPGTNFRISAGQLLLSLTGQEVSLGTGDCTYFYQYVEGSTWRELSNDVHSLSLLVYSSVAPLNFSVVLRDSPATKTLAKLCTITTANAWQLIQLPNLPAWPSGNWTAAPGSVGYTITICLAAGSTLIAPAADTWQTGNWIAAPGADNWASKPVNSFFNVAFVQHEPGPVCSTLTDKPFSQNYDECLKYYSKSYAYGTVGTTGTVAGAPQLWIPASQQPYVYVPFKKTMAKAPTITGFSTSGTVNSVRDFTSSSDRAITGVVNAGDSGFSGFALSTVNSSPWIVGFHYVADTGW